MASSNDKVALVRNSFEAAHQATLDALTRDLDPTVSLFLLSDHEETAPNAKPRVFGDGELIEKAACNFTYSQGAQLPSAASTRNPALTNKPFSASSLSVIVHPRHPHIPTAHMNVRFFYVDHEHGYWHFGGGMDLTPHILYEEDAVTWHEQARAACRSTTEYTLFKQQCDEYFYLPHRQEARGIGGLFFDDLHMPTFDACLQLALNVCEAFRTAYFEIVLRRKGVTPTPTDEKWMLHRRSRYAEFNLIHDRGTKYGLQSGRRIESVLASLPPRAHWDYARKPETPAQHALIACLQHPRAWL